MSLFADAIQKRVVDSWICRTAKLSRGCTRAFKGLFLPAAAASKAVALFAQSPFFQSGFDAPNRMKQASSFLSLTTAGTGDLADVLGPSLRQERSGSTGDIIRGVYGQ